jgi:putative flavoprotein involved in K+ transport
VTERNLQFSGSFANVCAAADLKQGRLLDQIDEFIAANGLAAEVGSAERPRPTSVPAPPTSLDLGAFETVVWATGFRPSYPWLDASLLDRKGAIRHDGGVMSAPGMYVLGLPFTRRRKSSFIDGAGPDAEDLSTHLARHLGGHRSHPLSHHLARPLPHRHGAGGPAGSASDHVPALRA